MFIPIVIILALAILVLVTWPLILLVAVLTVGFYPFIGWVFVIAAFVDGNVPLGLVLLITWLYLL